MTALSKIITSNDMLRRQYDDLQRGDTVLGRVALRPGEEYVLLDLVERGVRLVPAALPQLVSRSKTMQSRLFGAYMPPRTCAVHDIHQLLDAMAFYGEDEKIVTKLDRKDAGLGIHLWPSIEEVYTHASLGNLPFPFVTQPFHREARDIRVIVIGDFIEAYERHNAANFRNNLHCGGESRSWQITSAQLDICRQVMSRGKFPYAHVDLMMSEGQNYLMEISLRGGIRGAIVNAAEYKRLIAARQQEVFEKMG